MDNASYYKSLPNDTPNYRKTKKVEILQFFRENSIEHDESMTAPEIKMQLKRWTSQHITPECIQIAESAGHNYFYATLFL